MQQHPLEARRVSKGELDLISDRVPTPPSLTRRASTTVNRPHLLSSALLQISLQVCDKAELKRYLTILPNQRFTRSKYKKSLKLSSASLFL
jgi:hypothetical protein